MTGLHLPSPPAGWELDTFVGLQALPAAAGLGDDAELCHRFGVARYALYRLHGALRHGKVEVEYISGAFREFCRQGDTHTELAHE